MASTLVTLSEDGRPVCGGTAVGRHTFLTAEHCVKNGLATINGKEPCPEDGVVAEDGHDHVIVRTCHSFSSWSRIGKAPTTGQKVFAWGHPAGLPKMYFEGIVAGKAQVATSLAPLLSQAILIDLTSWHGASGSGVFNEKGEVVSLVSFGYTSPDNVFHLVGVWPFHFSTEQLRKIR